MINNSSLQKWSRLEIKSLDNQFINDIISGMSCSSFEAKAVLDTVHKAYGNFFDCSQELAPGKVKLIVISVEDIANRIFCCGERTVVRDLKELREKNIFIQKSYLFDFKIG